MNQKSNHCYAQRPKRRLGFFLAAVGIGFCLAGFSEGATYYVETTGVDTNPGTQAQPLRSIAAGLQLAQPGDMVHVGAGVVGGHVNTVRPGTAAAPIIVQGQGSGSTTTGSIVLNHDYVTVKGFRCLGSFVFGRGVNNSVIENCVSDLEPTTARTNLYFPPETNSCHNNIVRNCSLLNAKNKNQAVHLGGNRNTVEGCYITTNSNGADAVFIWGTDNVFRGNTIENWSQVPYDSNYHTDIFQTYTTNNSYESKRILIEGNIIRNCVNTQLGNITDDSFDSRISDWTFRNNIIIRVDAPLNLYAPNFKFYNNVFYKCVTLNGKYATPVVRTSKDRGNAHNTVLYNNIWYLCGQDTSVSYHGFYDVIAETGVPIQNFVADHNMAMGTGGGRIKNGKWTSVFGKVTNANGLNGVDPLFGNPRDAASANDVRVAEDSPVIGKGKNLSEFFSTDFFGQPRGAQWDIGAIEKDGALAREIRKPDGFGQKDKPQTN